VKSVRVANIFKQLYIYAIDGQVYLLLFQHFLFSIVCSRFLIFAGYAFIYFYAITQLQKNCLIRGVSTTCRVLGEAINCIVFFKKIRTKTKCAAEK